MIVPNHIQYENTISTKKETLIRTWAAKAVVSPFKYTVARGDICPGLRLFKPDVAPAAAQLRLILFLSC